MHAAHSVTQYNCNESVMQYNHSVGQSVRHAVQFSVSACRHQSVNQTICWSVRQSTSLSLPAVKMSVISLSAVSLSVIQPPVCLSV